MRTDDLLNANPWLDKWPLPCVSASKHYNDHADDLGYWSRFQKRHTSGLEEKISILLLTFWEVMIMLAGWSIKEAHGPERNSTTKRVSSIDELEEVIAALGYLLGSRVDGGASTASQWHKLFLVSLFKCFFSLIIVFPFQPPIQRLPLLATNEGSREKPS